jgi:hypothetical protein
MLGREDGLLPPIAGVAHVITGRKLEERQRDTSSWQALAWQTWEILGEIHYPTTQIARLVSRLDWNTEPEYDLESQFENPGLAEVCRVLALNLVVAGEAWLTKKGDTWTVYSTATPKLSTVLDEAEKTIRVWTPDPREPNKADSGVRAALSPAQELITLQNLSMAQNRSRAAAMGLLLRPVTRQPLLDDEGNPVDFNELLHEAMTAAIEDESSTSAVVPIDLELPADEIEHWTHIQFSRPYDERVDMRMERVIRRIALALDIWPELLLGVADINHWGSWFLSEDTWRSSTAPLANQVAQALEVAVLEVDNKEIDIEPDPAVLLARRSSVRDALNATWIGATGLKYLRTVIGATEDDAPTQEELDIIRLASGQRRSETRAGITAGEDEEIGTPQTGDQDSIQSSIARIAQLAGAIQDQNIGSDIETEMLGVELVRVDDQLSAWLEGAAETVTERARSAVGVRLRRAVRGFPEEKDLDLIDNAEVATILGEKTFEMIDVEAVVAATIEPLADRWAGRLNIARERVTDLVGDLDITDTEWGDARRRSVDLLTDTLTNHIINTLTEENPPFVDLRKVVAAAGLD